MDRVGELEGDEESESREQTGDSRDIGAKPF